MKINNLSSIFSFVLLIFFLFFAFISMQKISYAKIDIGKPGHKNFFYIYNGCKVETEKNDIDNDDHNDVVNDYYYDSEDNLIKLKSEFKDKNVTSVSYYSYNDNGYYKKIEHDMNNNGTIESYSLFIYDDEKLDKIKHYDCKVGLISKDNYIYNSDNKIKRLEQDQDNDSKPEVVSHYSYDGDILKKIEVDGNNNGVINQIIYYFYSNNKITKQKYDDNNDGTIDSIKYYSYDNDGKRVKITDDNNNDGNIDAVTTYIWNCDGDSDDGDSDDGSEDGSSGGGGGGCFMNPDASFNYSWILLFIIPGFMVVRKRL